MQRHARPQDRQKREKQDEKAATECHSSHDMARMKNIVAMFYATVQHGMSIQAHDGASDEALLAIAKCAMAAWDTLTSPTER